MKVSVDGGAPTTLVDALPDEIAGTRRTVRGGAWSTRGAIVYGGDYSEASLSRVSANGGAPAPATILASTKGDVQHRFPVFLPDGAHFLFSNRAAADDRRGIYVASIDDPPREPSTRLLENDSEVVYVPGDGRSGLLLQVVNGRILAQAFSPATLTAETPAVPLGIDAGGSTPFAPSMLSASRNVLAYVPAPLPYGNRIGSVHETGSDLDVVREREAHQWPRISPDGRRLAFLRLDPAVNNADIWVQDLVRRTLVRVTTGLERDLMPVWSPDGSRLAFRPDVADRRRLMIAAADGSGTTEAITCPLPYCEPTDWSPDGHLLIVNARQGADIDVWAVATTGGASSRVLLGNPFVERDARLSPDGRWIAYVSEESGRPNVSIRSLSGLRRYVVSADGGDQPVWQRDGRALFYVNPAGRLRKAAIQYGNGALEPSPSREVAVPAIGFGHTGTQYDVAADGRLYFLESSSPPSPTSIHVVLGWQGLIPTLRER
jgi:Tol biopolymer transport system component